VVAGHQQHGRVVEQVRELEVRPVHPPECVVPEQRQADSAVFQPFNELGFTTAEDVEADLRVQEPEPA
jgi:hypothetical protein